MDFELLEDELENAKIDLKPLKRFEVVIFDTNPRLKFYRGPYIDVAVITRERNREKNKETWWDLLGKAPEKYYISIFELLPLPKQISIADDFAAVYGSRLDLSEYFYFYRKLWKDVEPRYKANQFKSVKEKIAALANAAKLLS